MDITVVLAVGDIGNDDRGLVGGELKVVYLDLGVSWISESN